MVLTRSDFLFHMKDLSNDIEYSDKAIQSKEVFQCKGNKLLLLAFKRGQKLNSHSSPYEIVLTVLEGSCDLTVGAESKILLAGSVVYISAKQPHALSAITNLKLSLFQCQPI